MLAVKGSGEGHRVEGGLPFSKTGRTTTCLFAAGKEPSGRERLERKKGEGMRGESLRKEKRLNPQIWLHNLGGVEVGQVRTCTGLWGLKTAAHSPQQPV